MRFNNRNTALTSRNNLLYVSGQLGMTSVQLMFQTFSDLKATNLSSLLSSGEVHISVDYLLFNTRNLFIIYSLYRKGALTRIGKREKNP